MTLIIILILIQISLNLKKMSRNERLSVNEWGTELQWKIHPTFLCPIRILPPPTSGIDSCGRVVGLIVLLLLVYLKNVSE